MAESLPSILCVDDDVDVLELLKEYFTEQGFVVLTATNGVEAFLQVKRWQPKAVILDLFMPRLGGIGALGRIKALNPDVAVILVSGMGNALELVTEAGLSVAGAFTKPLDLTQLSETLARSGVVAPAALVAAAAGRPRAGQAAGARARARGGRRARVPQGAGRVPRGPRLRVHRGAGRRGSAPPRAGLPPAHRADGRDDGGHGRRRGPERDQDRRAPRPA